MKYTVRLIIAVLAASAALVSCTKDLAPGKSDTDSAAGTLRTVTVSFDTPTKSYLDGNQPRFSKGDSVLVSDGTALDTCAVDVDGKKTIIRTKLEGETLSAVYPYTVATVYNDFKLEVKIPAIQTGKFADANICMAEQSSDKSSLRFRNRVAILKFYADESIGVDTIRVISGSKENIASGADTIVVTAPKVEKSQLSNPTQDPRIWYVAMDNIKDATSLTFESVTKTQGTVTKKPKQVSGDNSIGKGYIYSAFIPYYIKVKVNDTPETYQKWAYCNVGAFLPEEPGLYFAWGEVQGHKANTAVAGKEFQEDFEGFKFDSRYWPKFKGGEGFAEINSPFYNDTGYSKYTGNGDILVAEDDAATVNWGSGWRMPDAAEFNTLTTVQPGKIETMLSYQNVGFPYAGYGENVGLAKGKSFYWTRTISDDEGKKALAFHLDGPQNMTMSRYNGFPIRPIYDDTISEDQTATVTISAYSNGGTL